MELKKCPFCGSRFNVFGSVLGNCTNERCILNTITINVQEWNTRPIEDRLQSENQKLKEELEQVKARLRARQDDVYYQFCQRAEASLAHDKEIDAQSAQLQKYKEALVYFYNQGYMSGHHDTVEGGYVDIVASDMDTYHSDIVEDIIAEQALRKEE